MNVEQAIHERWAARAELETLLPAERLTTGQTSSGALPYAMLHVRTVRPELPTNEGPAIAEIAFQITVWHDRYDEARAIVEQIREVFDAAALAVAEPAGTARVRHVADSIKQHPDGWWQWNVDFTARVSRQSY